MQRSMEQSVKTMGKIAQRCGRLMYENIESRGVNFFRGQGGMKPDIRKQGRAEKSIENAIHGLFSGLVWYYVM